MLTEIRERSMARKARPKLQQVTHTTILTQIQHEYDVTRPRSQNHQKVFFFSLIVSINRIRFLKKSTISFGWILSIVRWKPKAIQASPKLQVLPALSAMQVLPSVLARSALQDIPVLSAALQAQTSYIIRSTSSTISTTSSTAIYTS